uniref:BTB domain-containing protein n=1 Tax=Globodera rostochiensis TaxID=31243 RepID=A0A914GPU9_GLORO
MNDDIYVDYAIVEETTAIDMKKRCNQSTTFSDLTMFAALEFEINSTKNKMTIKDIGNASQSANAAEPLAQIVLWQWNGGTQEIQNKMLLNTGGNVETKSLNYGTSVVVRILKKRALNEKNGGCLYKGGIIETLMTYATSIVVAIFKNGDENDNPCPPVFSPNDDLSVHIGDRQITVSTHWLMSVSPVVNRMLSVEMKEKRERTLNLDGLGIEMEQFKSFLEAISMSALHNRTLPNPKNVVSLLKLADYFQVDWLKKQCEAHLIHCVEIPAIERFQLIERYRLNKLEQYFMRCLNSTNLREFFKANIDQLMADGFISKKLLSELILRLC